MRTPTYLQMEAAECGPAALGIMLAHFGRIVPLAELRRECGVSRDGSNALNIVRAAERYGLEANGYSWDAEAFRTARLPVIAYWDFNHFVVVEGFGRNVAFLNDPAVGHRTASLEEFDESFTGLVLVMEPGPAFEKGGHQPSVVAALRRRIRGAGSTIGFAVLAGFLLVIPGLAIPAFTQVFLDEVLILSRTDWLRPLILAMIVTIAAQALVKFLQLRCLRDLRLSLSAKLSAQFFRHLLRLPLDFYEQRFAGEISDRSALNDKVAGVLSGQLAQTVIDAVMMVFYVALMLFYSVSLTLIGVFFAVLHFVALRRASRWRVEANMRLLQEYGKVSGSSIAGLQSIETIKASGLEQGFFNRWSGHFANASNTRQGFLLTNELLAMMPDTLLSLTNALVLVVGGVYVVNGWMTIGMLMAFRILIGSFLRPVGSLVRLGQTVQELGGDLARLDDVLGHPVDPSEAGGEQVQQDGRVRLTGRLELAGVSFGYNPTRPPLIEGFDLSIAPGRRVALVGSSGSGKSTVAKLVCGLYRPWSGEVLLDGMPRDSVAADVISRSISLVDQEILLFAGTLRENLTLWDPTVPEATLEAACRDAEIHERVRRMPGGLDGELSERGTNLSGGERQRLEIARALVNDPALLVLDEATSALDPEVERRIVERIERRGCACLIVAHRLSTIRDCDEIIVLDGGKVVERGTHEELWALCGSYRALLETGGVEAVGGAA